LKRSFDFGDARNIGGEDVGFAAAFEDVINGVGHC